MDRISLINSYFQKKDQLTVDNLSYQTHLAQLFEWITTADDIKNDITTKTLNLTGKATAQIIVKQNGVIAGLKEVLFLISTRIPLISPMGLIQDGDAVQTGDVILKLSGPVSAILVYERSILNILGRMSGIATDTHNLISLIEKVPNAPRIAATRKTPWMLLDKKAVAVGGGLTHRLSLSDSILIKDNHLMALQQEKNFKTAEETIQHTIAQIISKNVLFFEIEVATTSQALTAIETFINLPIYDIRNTKYERAMVLLLDNMKPHEVAKIPKHPNIILEASGDITEKTIEDWAQTGVDILSIGTLTHSCQNFNLSMRF